MKPNSDAISELKELAETILYHKRNRRKGSPIIIEFSGSPKSGKSSCCSALDLFLRRNGFNTRVVFERSHFAKIRNKRDPIFNIWTMSHTIAELAEILGTSCECNAPDVILIDRGVFDALCWFDWLHRSQRLDSRDYENFKNYILSPKWTEMIDLVFVFTASPSDSIGREFSQLLTENRGSIMEESTLAEINKSIAYCMESYGHFFKAVDSISTSKSNDLEEFNYKVTTSVLRILGHGVEEKIAYVDRKKLKPELPTIFKLQEASLTYHDVDFKPRNKIEKDPSKLQLVPIAIIIDKKKDLILCGQKSKIAARKSNPEFEKMLIYFGGHIRYEDTPSPNSLTLISMLGKALTRELKEELDVDIFPTFSNNSKVIWVRNGTRSDQHLAVCSICEVDSTRFNLKSNVLEFSSDDKIKVSFRRIEDIASHFFLLEEWGCTILTNIGKIDLNKRFCGAQMPLFDELDE